MLIQAITTSLMNIYFKNKMGDDAILLVKIMMYVYIIW